jgi:N-acetylglutamate synthase-like GNAT family acetyltransferase
VIIGHASAEDSGVILDLLQQSQLPVDGLTDHLATTVVAREDGRIVGSAALEIDTIPHSALITCVARRISDGKMLHLIKMWLKAPVEETDAQGHRRMSGGKKATRGTPQGG